MERCPICGSVYEMNYVGKLEDEHGHDDHHGHHDEPWDYYRDGFPELRAEVAKPKWWDYVRPEYRS